jgi:hypothetical protein
VTTITVYDYETGETIVRDMTDVEEANLLVVQTEAQAQIEAAAAKTAAREALLVRLGITAEEAQLLLGGI